MTIIGPLNKPPSTAGIWLRYITGGPRAVFDPNWKSGCRRSALTVVVGLFVIFIAIVLLQAILTPWGRSLSGAPTLTGRWVSDAAPLAFVDIEGLIWGADDGGCLRNCDVQGKLRVCSSTGVIQSYTFSGDVAGRHARTFRLDVNKENDVSYGWMLSNLKGEWAGGDTLHLAGEWISDPPRREVRIVMDSAGNTVMDPPPEPERRKPLSMTLHRGREDAFITACSNPRKDKR